MFAVCARYRGRSTRRAEHVRASGAALSRLDGVGTVTPSGVEELSAHPGDAVAVTTLTLALLAAGDWSVGIGVSPAGDADAASVAAVGCLGTGGRAGTVRARIRTGDPAGKELSDDIAAAFTLLHHVISRRSPEGREATNLMRAGWTQVETAAELGVSKQAINQRLQAAGWHAEEAGWSLAVHLLQRAARI